MKRKEKMFLNQTSDKKQPKRGGAGLQSEVIGSIMVGSHDQNGRQLGILHVQSVSGEETGSKNEQEVKSQDPLPVTHFLQSGSTSLGFHTLPEQHHQLGSKY